MSSQFQESQTENDAVLCGAADSVVQYEMSLQAYRHDTVVQYDMSLQAYRQAAYQREAESNHGSCHVHGAQGGPQLF